jgi:UDPglucose 6-dehydrogenase
MINNGMSPIHDKDIQEHLSIKSKAHQVTKSTNNSFTATNNKEFAYKISDYIVIATPTDYDDSKDSFNTDSLEKVIEDVLVYSKDSTIIIKSTVPIGFTERIKEKLKTNNLIFSPEFLREGSALHDNLYPSRIIIGEKSERAQKFYELLLEGAIKKDIEVLFTNSSEAESIKLFSNSYLAMRVSFFNELDSFAEHNNLDTEKIIKGLSLDSRIGSHYNNPSFGYGGYCLPKDTKQLKSNFNDIPNSIIDAIVDSNLTRQDFIVNSIINKNPSVVGIYRLIMKSGSDNFRDSAVLQIINRLRDSNIIVIIYEPALDDYEHDNFLGSKVVKNLEEFKKSADLIIANRLSSEITDVKEKIYSRDIFNLN